MNKIIIDENYIKSLPLTTNRIEVAWNENVFFSKYAIVSYYSTSAEHKNLAYEQLSDSPCLSVAGIKAIWGNQKYSAVKFFILTHKGNARDILNSLQSFKDIVARIDSLEPYSNELKNRIVASLAINSLGKKKTSNMMYNDGSLLVCDNTNFGIQKRELVCLKVEVNKYMNLVANTQSFTHPLNDNELRKYKNCVFQKSKDFDGELWSGQAVKPITIKTVKDGEYDLNKLFILKKKSKKTKNNVPYWPYNPDKYTHGKLFVLFQVVESVNQDFDGILEINFTDYKVEHYDECKTEDGILKLMRDYLKGKTISFEDSFCTDLSKNLILQFKEEAQKIMQGTLEFPFKPTPEDMIVRLCEPKENEDTNTKYIKSTYRFTKNNNAHPAVSEHLSENLIYDILLKAIAELGLPHTGVLCHYPLSRLITDWNQLEDKEKTFAESPFSHIDFLLYNSLTKQPISAIEVDGWHFHKENDAQLSRDKLKNQIFTKLGLPLIRISTTDTVNQETIKKSLLAIL